MRGCISSAQRPVAPASQVYSEMQARENTCDDITDRRLLEELFPDCGYSSETNGLLENLRKLSVDQVRQYVEHTTPT